MDFAVIQLVVLAGIAIFLIMRLRSVLGTRDGFEKPPVVGPDMGGATSSPRRFEVIDGGPDSDITDHAEVGSSTARALAEMKAIDPSFHVGDFLKGARGAYEMILMAFENGEMDSILPFLSRDVFSSFDDVVQSRERQGLTVEANFIGVRELDLVVATFDNTSSEGEITVRFVGELTSVVHDANGVVVEGDANAIKRQKDVWTFARDMGAGNPNWQLVATGE
jgi:predicted lipid-binding transport protein (Tim44 family)